MASRVSKIYGDAYVSLQAEEGRLEEAGKETLAQEDDPPDGPAGDAGGSQSDGAAAVQDAAAHELM